MSALIQEEKHRRRLSARRLRDAIPPAERRAESLRIAARLFSLTQYEQAEAVFLYLSFGSEVETAEIARRVLSDGKRLLVPHCLPSERKMRLFAIRSRTQLARGAYGIPAPKAALIRCGALPEATRADAALTLVPGLCFDRAGHRIGYGGGYYDRFLDGYRGTAVGLAYAACLFDALPQEPCDRPVDIILTGAETIRAADKEERHA